MSKCITPKKESINYEFSTTCTTHAENYDKQTSSNISYEEMLILSVGVCVTAIAVIAVMPVELTAGTIAFIAGEVIHW
jgi:hypothetical protein